MYHPDLEMNYVVLGLLFAHCLSKLGQASSGDNEVRARLGGWRFISFNGRSLFMTAKTHQEALSLSSIHQSKT